jgi:hypothetical protein
MSLPLNIIVWRYTLLIEQSHHISTPKTKLPQTFGDVRGGKNSVNGAGVRVIQ